MLSFVSSPDYLRSAEMTEVMMSTPAMDEIGLSPRKDGLSYQVSARSSAELPGLGRGFALGNVIARPAVRAAR